MQKDSVRAFKNELRNYTYYLSRIVSLENSIEFLYDRLGGVRGIDPSKEPLHTVPNKEMEWKIRDDISKLEKTKERTEAKVMEIDSVLNRIESPLRNAIINIYVVGKQVKNTCDYYYLSPSGLVSRMNKAIEEALDE